MNYKKLNVYLGWLVFLIATTVYFITIEDTVSLWDCGEYITAAYKLEVGHPPGAPLFMLLGRLFSFFAAPENVAVWINRMSALSSSFTILFMFWSITMLAKRMVQIRTRVLSKGDIIAVLGSGFIGAMAYTFSDSFWFSAVEGEVYAMSSLFTAIIFWAILKWDEEMDAMKHAELSEDRSHLRWMILIMFLFGLAIGVHLLGLLILPTIVYVIYFRYYQKTTLKGLILTGIIGVFLLGFIQDFMIPGTISIASSFEISFVNSLGLPFYSGTVFFFVLLIVALIFVLRWTRKKGKVMLNAATLGVIVFLLGYGSFATIVIRSNANTPLDENNPENLVTLYSYLKREQYGSAPILYGPYWNSEMGDPSSFGDRSPVYARRFVVMKNDQAVKAFIHEENATKYAKEQGNRYEVVEKYFMANENFRKNQEPKYAQNTIFPRMFWNQDANKVEGYKKWSGYSATDDISTEIGNDGLRLPTFSENLTYFARYQVNWMYWRYFMWNFAGRQNDIQGHGDEMRGNWLSGISAIDELRLGSQAHLPISTAQNEGYNRFFFLPLILGFIGMFFHFYRSPKDAFIVLLSFIFTGLAIVVYLNQKTFEPRERDYAYAASFYVFAMWIGLGVYALYESYLSFKKKEFKGLGIIAAGGLLFCIILDLKTGNFAATLSWIFISVVAAVLLGIMSTLGAKSKNDAQGASIAVVLTLVVPFIMAVQGWDDHDRSDKTSARDLAYNYLQSCKKNGIIFTNGDNDTFPLWYMQEVEGVRTDVRVANLSLMGTDWYTDQMKMKAYDSEPLPIKFKEDQIMMYAGGTDQVYLLSILDLISYGVPQATIQKIFDLKLKYNPSEFAKAFQDLRGNVLNSIGSLKAKNPSGEAILARIRSGFNTDTPKYSDISKIYTGTLELLNGYRGGLFDENQNAVQGVQQAITSWETTWDFLPMDIAMEFTRDDRNMFSNERSGKTRIFPSKGFILKVNKKNAIASGLVAQKDAKNMLNEIRFTIEKQYLTREQVMMMDVLANNDWKRPIYFSSPYGSDVSIALFKARAINQNGMAFEISPLAGNRGIDMDKMYDNVMNVYSYGKMNQAGVLSDYYTRRHTGQFRTNFLKLADSYIQMVNYEEQRVAQTKNQISSLRQAGRNNVADSLAKTIVGTDNLMKEYNTKAANLVKKSLEVMPIDRVLDYGEPNPSNEKFTVSRELSYPGFSDGVMQDYVKILYMAGDKKAGTELAKKVASQLEMNLKYFENSDVMIATNNTSDFISTLNNYILLSIYVNDEDFGDPKSAIAKQLSANVNNLYKNVFPKMYAKLKELGSDAGESVSETGRGYYSGVFREFKGHIDAVGMQYGIVGRPVDQLNNLGGGQQSLTPEQIQMMMDQQQ